MMDFIVAALPWVLMGLSIAVAVVSLYKYTSRNKQKKEETLEKSLTEMEEKEDAGTNGLALGISIGMMLGSSFGMLFDNLAMGCSMGLLWGVILGNLYDARKKK